MFRLLIWGVLEKRRFEMNDGSGRDPIGPDIDGDRGIVVGED